MINTRLLKTTLMVASAAIALTAAPAWADAWSDGDGAAVTGTSYSDAISISYDSFSGITKDNATTITQSGESGSYSFSGSDSEGYQGAWVFFTDANQSANNYTFSVSSEISGTGFLGVAIKVGDGGATGIIDLTEASATNFSGQLMALNVWNSSVKTKLGGTSWANTEYVFGSVSREWWDPYGTLDAAASNTVSGDFLALAGNGNTGSSYEVETLELSSSTSLAGISGTEKDYTDNIDFNSREAITAANADTTLTITGTGNYEFYGTVGSSDVVLDIAKTGSGTQTFGGTNYLGNVSVTNGALVLGTLSVTTSGTTVSGSGDISITEVNFGDGGSTLRTLTIGTEEASTTVKVGSVTVNGNTTIDVASGSTLAVEGTLNDHSGYSTSISGDGTLTADKLEISGAGSVTLSVANASFGSISQENTGTLLITSANLNIGEGGITKTEDGTGDIELTTTTVGLYNTNSVTISADLWLNGGTDVGTTFNTETGQTMTLTGDLTGGGALVKTGDGTLVLSGTAQAGYAGGTTISAGTVVATTEFALGQGDVTVANGATLELDAAITIGEGSVSFNTGSLLVIGSDLLASAVVESDADPEVAMVAATAVEIISATSITFGDTVLESGDVSETVNDFISSDITSAYDLTWTYDGSALSVSATATTPEPSMFGLLAGLGALGLVATRRRRNRKA